MKIISEKRLTELEAGFDRLPCHALAMNSVFKNGIDSTCGVFDVQRRMRYGFSLELETGAAKNQKQSGRCWMFAALNTMAFEVMRRLKLEDFEFSQAYIMFFDKLEKANHFLESIIETARLPLTDRLVSHLLTEPLGDGGQWDMFRSLVEKYGVVPKEMMPESFHSSNSAALNKLMTAKLREYAAELRSSLGSGILPDALGKIKDEMLDEIYKTLCIALGRPPRLINIELRDRDKNFIRIANTAPKEFFEKYVGLELSDFASLINAPTADKPFHKTYTVAYLASVRGGHDVRYLNLPAADLKKYALAQLKDGFPVWFGCDVGKFLDREYGSMDLRGFDYESAFGYTLGMTKAQRLDYHESLMTHAMVFTGVDLDLQGRPQRWRVENSWGEERGKKGYYVMSDEWFSEYLYQILINKRYLPEQIIHELEQPPLVLEPWDPMGSLA
ncbi:MAG: C1 family peptidase [Oscillospiraceae bacterium]